MRKGILLLFSTWSLACTVQAQHQVTLKTGEKLQGEVQSISNSMLYFMQKGQKLNFAINEVKAIDFSPESSSNLTTGTSAAGKGISYIMPGRKLIRQPKIDNLTMESGVVVVSITINKYGNVTAAEPGAEGTTTTSQYLLSKAKQAAESVQFDTGPTMPISQKGSLTITF